MSHKRIISYSTIIVLIGVIIIAGLGVLIPGPARRVARADVPTNPKGSFAIGGANDVFVSGSYAYVAATGRLVKVDISDPTNPIEVDDTQKSGLLQPNSVYVSDPFAYSTTYDGKLARIDINGMSILNRYQDPDWLNNGADDVAVSGNYAYVAAWVGLYVVDVSGATLQTVAKTGDVGAYRVEISGNQLYLWVRLGGASCSLTTYDISDPSNPTFLSEDYGTDYCNAPIEVSLNGWTYKIIVGSDDVRVYDSSTGEQEGWYEISGPNGLFGGNYIFVTDGSSLRIFDSGGIVRPEAPIVERPVDSTKTRTLIVSVNDPNNPPGTEYQLWESNDGTSWTARGSWASKADSTGVEITTDLHGDPLNPASKYWFAHQARLGNGYTIDPSYSNMNESSYFTWPESGAPNIDRPTDVTDTDTLIVSSIDRMGNPSGVEYAIKNITNDRWLNKNGGSGEVDLSACGDSCWAEAEVWGWEGVTNDFLLSGTTYTYKTKARIPGEPGTETSLGTFSNSETTWSEILPPGEVSLSRPASQNDTDRLIINDIANPNGNPDTYEYAIYVDNLSQYVQRDGSLGASEDWQTIADWQGTVNTGLSTPGAPYTYKAKSVNPADYSVTSGWGPSSTKYTWPEVPPTPSVSNVSVSEQNIVVNKGLNDSSVEYRVEVKTSSFTEVCGAASSCVSPSGGDIGSCDAGDWSTWDNSATLTNLIEGTTYYYRVQARSEDGGILDTCSQVASKTLTAPIPGQGGALPVRLSIMKEVVSDGDLNPTDGVLQSSGQTVRYKITVKNWGTQSTSQNYTITDILPPGFSYVAGSASKVPSTVQNRKIIWILTDPIGAGGGSLEITYDAKAP